MFEKHDGLVKSLKLSKLEPVSTEEEPVLTGLSKWICEYNSTIYNHEKLREEVDEYMQKYDSAEAKKSQTQEVDDEGWTVVTKKGRKPGISRKESVENKIIQKNKIKSKRKQLKNFYTFQMKEEKMKNIVALRKSFEESKQKVEAMKKSRNFKPL